MAVTSDITVSKTGYMGKYTNDEAAPASATVQITIDGGTVQSQLIDIPANDFICLFGDWTGVNTSISHEICAKKMAVVSDITIFQTGYMGKYTNEYPEPTSATVQITIDGGTVQSQLADIPANDFVCLFGDWSGVDPSISHTICATIEEVLCPPPTASFSHSGEPCT